ncbi:MAG: alpha/beta fold hydrolase, partial [Nitrosopumilaceae archaeon]|nr:alpha/beta fold hydrolase [Nitrosopumilaceae archaeon]NIU85902.1 alpha/beta fold hydrolase [Nitrosopumilaceae archaeon]NIV64736.1 alpha/beta fold hydrolase [Nitrosopumilaceae archaeon]NIX60133.1 alpha/beta fold hydrolase [Nitrosopumilaceae archaeon]
MQEKFVTIAENKIRYLESDTASKNLVLIHGLGASAERWNRIFPYVEKKYRIVAPDLIGFGYSEKPLVDYTIEFFRDFLKTFLDSIGI